MVHSLTGAKIKTENEETCHLNILIRSKKDVTEADVEKLMQFMREIYVQNNTGNQRTTNFSQHLEISKNVLSKLLNYLSITGQSESKKTFIAVLIYIIRIKTFRRLRYIQASSQKYRTRH